MFIFTSMTGLILFFIIITIVYLQSYQLSREQKTVRDPVPPYRKPLVQVREPISLLEECGLRGIGTYYDEILHPKKAVYPKWFVSDYGKNAAISPAEQLIINELSKYNVKWAREVSFMNMVLPSGYHAGYDFYLPDHHTIIEYNGKEWHCSPDRVKIDNLKIQFCKENNIDIITYDRYDYFRLSEEIATLMNELNVIPLRPLMMI